ncbi:hypothetical protein [Pseudonocardia sp. TRM90224]|uniref:hypothetical protein n=1 Tax=Pseudonocardia sp. TRM90224 TaxID=2812678 RepID=UPI001E488205|nr:hypothetical protein [Pseudonocardia sp. TRM90224]
MASIVGTVARPGQFDRGFRPLTARAVRHADRIARLQAAGAVLPPVQLIRVGGLHFVEDGHHRVAAAVATDRCGGRVTPRAAAEWWAVEMEGSAG